MAGFARIEALLGAPLADADEDALQRLVDGGIREDTDLEFKGELYGNGDSDRRDLAGDVAALANAGGGLIVLGIREDDALAVELTPVPVSDAEELRIHQIVASNAAPHVAFDLVRVTSHDDPSTGWYLLAVPRSPWAPHAVRVGNALRYPRRDGAGVRWLSESEVADSYRDRFTAAQAQVERLDDVLGEGRAALGGPLADDAAWLTVAVVPDTVGEMRLTRVGVREMEWFVRNLEGVPSFTDSTFRYHSTTASAGHRRVVLKLDTDSSGIPRAGVLHLHTDGSSYVAVDVGWRPSTTLGGPENWVNVNDERLTEELFWSLLAAARHAVVNCRTTGDAALEAQLISKSPMMLSHGRGQFHSGGHWTEEQISQSGPSGHTIALESVSESVLDLVVAARTAVTDLVQSFGLAECAQIAADGTIRRKYWKDMNRVDLECARFGLATTDDTIG